MLRAFDIFYYRCECVFVVVGCTVDTHLVAIVMRATLKRPSSRRIPSEYSAYFIDLAADQRAKSF